MYHYVYRLNWPKGRYYIGARSSTKEPNKDPYMGSGNACLYGVKWERPVKEILSVHPTRDEALREESRLLILHVGKTSCQNRRRTNCKKFAIAA